MKKTSILSLICALAAFGVCLSSCDLDAHFGETPHQHTYSEEWSYDEDYHWHEADCEHKDEGYIEDLEKHTFGEEPIYVEIESGCGSYGLFYKECLVCGYVKAFESEPTGLHNFGEYQSNEDIHWIECLDCGYVLPSPHNYVLDETNSYKENCGEDGLEVYNCSTCGYSLEKVLTATGNHSYGIYQVDGEQHYQECSVCGDRVYGEHMLVYNSSLSLAPTCVEPGYDTYTCLYCDYSTNTQVPAGGDHTPGDYLDSDETGHFYYCLGCGEKVNFEEHSFEYYRIGTYSEGYHYSICSVCGYETEVVPHNFEMETLIEVDCVNDGLIRYTCSECEYYYEEEIPATGEHKYDLREYTVEPTCTAFGSGYLICSVCGARRSAIFSQLGHDYESGVYSYNEDGHYQVCTRCGNETEVVSHKLNEEIITEPTCTETGLEHVSCTICDYDDENFVVPANGHDYDLTEAIYSAPTCTEDGSITAVCKVCGAQAYNEVIPATGHTYGDYIQNGDYHYRVCSVCHESSTPELHSASEELSIDVDGHNSVCKDCGATLSYNYHTYEDGLCTVCGYELPFKYTINSDETVTINGLKNAATDVTFASCINGYPVTAIGNSKKPIDNGDKLKTIYVPSSVIEIEYEAFYQFSNLQSVCLSEGLTTIGDYAFYYNTKLEGTLRLPDSLISIGADAFYKCTSLTSIEIGQNLETLGHNAFYSCSAVSSVTMTTNKLEVIPNSCFYDCRALTYIEIPASVTTIEDAAFNDCRELHDIILPVSVTRIGEHVFGSMSSTSSTICLKNVYYMGLPSDLASIEIASNQSGSGLYVGSLDAATWYYYDEDGSIYGNDPSNTYWHYVEGVPTLW